jgi:UDP-GlcNAc:undecaprenyl-phosphate GlcNAc-1-phosphate transferase
MILIASLFCLFYLDDVFSIKPAIRLFTIGITVFILIKSNSQLEITQLSFSSLGKIYLLENFSIYFTVLCFLLLINAVNLMDGINGLCVMHFLIWLFLLNDVYNMSLILITAPIVIFFILNLKNKIFLGNSGSYLIGLITAVLIVLNYNSKYVNNIEIIFIYLSIPGLDLFRVFVERLINKRHPFRADKNHLHHLLSQKYTDARSLIIYMMLTIVPIFACTIVEKKFYYLIIASTISIYMYITYRLKRSI